MRKKTKAVSLIVAASLILNMFGCAQKADATIAIAMGMFACTVRMDLAAGQSDGDTGQDAYEQMANTETQETTENGSLFIYDIALEDGTQGKHYHAYSMGRETTLFYKIYVFDNGDIYGKIGKDRIFFSNVEGATEVPDYDYVEDGLMYG